MVCRTVGEMRLRAIASAYRAAQEMRLIIAVLSAAVLARVLVYRAAREMRLMAIASAWRTVGETRG